MRVQKYRQPRVDLEVSIKLNLKDDDMFCRAETLDVSEGGFKINKNDGDMFNSFGEGALLDFETHEDFFKIKGVGKIAWVSQERNTAGINFEQMDDESKDLLNDFLGVCLK